MQAGAVLLGRYRVEALIGRGGMGHVYSAVDLEGGPDVAVKVVSEAAKDAVLATRLLREAEAVTRLRSDWVPRLLEIGQTEEGEVFLVLERLVGTSLSQRLREAAALPWEEVARIGEDVLRGLIDAHTAGVVHRDLKPSNVFLATRGAGNELRTRAMILDFGVCKIQGDDREHLTGTGESLGTVAYMAPEQVRGAADVDERADLYAFGVVVYQMLTGTLPHEGPTQMATLASKLEKPPPPLAGRARSLVPDGLDALVARTLAREPEDRFDSAQALLKAWRALDPRLDVRGSAPSLPSGKPPPPAPRSSARTVVSAPPAPSSRDLTRNLSVLEDGPHATDTQLTAGLSLTRGPRAMHVALVLAAVALLGGVVVVMRIALPPSPARLAAPEATASLPEVPLLAPEPPSAAPASVVVSALPSATASSSPSSAPRRPPARPAASGPHITAKPRY